MTMVKRVLVSASVSVLWLACMFGATFAEEASIRLEPSTKIDCLNPSSKILSPRYAQYCADLPTAPLDGLKSTAMNRILLVDLGERELKKRQELRR